MLGTCSVFVLKMNMKSIIECAELEETLKNHGVQLFSPGHPQDSCHLPKGIVQTHPELVRLGAVSTFW